MYFSTFLLSPITRVWNEDAQQRFQQVRDHSNMLQRQRLLPHYRSPSTLSYESFLYHSRPPSRHPPTPLSTYCQPGHNFCHLFFPRAHLFYYIIHDKTQYTTTKPGHCINADHFCLYAGLTGALWMNHISRWYRISNETRSTVSVVVHELPNKTELFLIFDCKYNRTDQAPRWRLCINNVNSDGY